MPTISLSSLVPYLVGLSALSALVGVISLVEAIRTRLLVASSDSSETTIKIEIDLAPEGGTNSKREAE